MACSNNFTEEADFSPTAGFTDYPPYLCPVDNLTGYEDMATKVMDRMLLTQYATSTNLQEYMTAFISQVDVLLEEVHKVEYGRYIQNATQAQLDVIGVILQQTRNLNIPKAWFGFQGAEPVDGMANEITPLAGGVFRSEDDPLTVATELNDIQYRRVLLCRGYTLNQATFDVNTVYKAIETALGKIPANIKLYEDTERNWILELNAEYTTSEEVGLIRAIQHWFVPMIVNLNIRLRLFKQLVNGFPITDVFIYRTIDDDDNGLAITGATTQTWYGEELYTLTRGKTKAFPAVALLVLEDSKLTIYDATKSDLPMWMVFYQTGYGSGHLQHQGSGFNTVTAKNGRIYVGTGSAGMNEIRFIEDITWMYLSLTTWGGSSISNIVDRNTYDEYALGTGTGFPPLTNSQVRDIAVTSDGTDNIVYVASADGAGGGGVSRIDTSDYSTSYWTDDGNTVNQVYTLAIFDGYIYWNVDSSPSAKRTLTQLTNIPLVEHRYYDTAYQHFVGDASMVNAGILCNYTYGGQNSYSGKLTNNAIGSSRSLTKLYPNPSDWGASMIANITKDFSTGIQHGDITGCLMASTDIATLGVDETTNKVVNGHFTTNWDGWSAGNNADLSIVGGRLRVTCTDLPSASARQTISGLTVGKSYKVTAELYDGSVIARADVDYLGHDGNQNLTEGEYTFTAKFQSVTIQLYAQGSSAGHYVEFDNVALTESGNLISCSEVNRDTFLIDWLFVTPNTTLSIVNNALRVTNGTTYGVGYQIIPTILGRQYEVTATATVNGIAVGSPALRVGYSPGQNELVQENFYSVPKTISARFTGNGSDVYISLLSGSLVTDEYSDFDNISVRLVDDDRSYNNEGYAIHGQLQRTPVASGAELVGYSGFSPNNFLDQYYNNKFNFGTGDFYIMGWIKPGGFSYRTIFARDEIPANSLKLIHIDTGLDLDMRFIVGPTGHNTSLTLVPDVYQFFCFYRKDGVLYPTLNAIQGSTVASLADMSSAIAISRFGERPNPAGSSFDGSMSLMRVGAGAPTQTQIETIYNQEKKMFEPDAKVTLQGSTSDVKALDYDIYRQTIKACTSYHITTFKDLVVTEDEATIATSISTINGGTLTGSTSGANYET